MQPAFKRRNVRLRGNDIELAGSVPAPRDVNGGRPVARLNAGLEACRAKGDNGSRILLEKILTEEEEHIDWLEAQLGQIEEMGLPNYLAQQIED